MTRVFNYFTADARCALERGTICIFSQYSRVIGFDDRNAFSLLFISKQRFRFGVPVADSIARELLATTKISFHIWNMLASLGIYLLSSEQFERLRRNNAMTFIGSK